MPSGETLFLLAQLRTVAGRPSAISILLWCGLALFTVVFGVLTTTQWGQSKPLVKCLGLSLFAHLLILTAMWGTTVFYPHGASVAGDPNGIRVRMDADIFTESVSARVADAGGTGRCRGDGAARCPGQGDVDAAPA